MAEFDTHDDELVICPWCRCAHTPPDIMRDLDGFEMRCGDTGDGWPIASGACGKSFRITVHESYSTKRVTNG